MPRFLLRRLLITLAMLLAVSMLAFAVPWLSGGDPVRHIIRARVADQAIDPAAIEGLRLQLGLDRPIPAQYLEWLGKALQGDFGVSFTSRLPVGRTIAAALMISAILASSALLLALAVALPLVTLAACGRAARWMASSPF